MKKAIVVLVLVLAAVVIALTTVLAVQSTHKGSSSVVADAVVGPEFTESEFISSVNAAGFSYVDHTGYVQAVAWCQSPELRDLNMGLTVARYTVIMFPSQPIEFQAGKRDLYVDSVMKTC